MPAGLQTPGLQGCVNCAVRVAETDRLLDACAQARHHRRAAAQLPRDQFRSAHADQGQRVGLVHLVFAKRTTVATLWRFDGRMSCTTRHLRHMKRTLSIHEEHIPMTPCRHRTFGLQSRSRSALRPDRPLPRLQWRVRRSEQVRHPEPRVDTPYAPTGCLRRRANTEDGCVTAAAGGVTRPAESPVEPRGGGAT